MKNILRGVAAAFAAVVLITISATPAAAVSDRDTFPSETVSIVENVAGEIDAAVAEANGYVIVTNADGSQSSIPVTAEAIAREAEAAEARADAIASGEMPSLPQTRGEVVGDCGWSWVYATKLANDWLAISNTGYTVFGAVVAHSWTVVGVGFITSNQTSWSAGTPNSGSWSGSVGMTVVGPGVAGVTATSFAVLASGQTCYSGVPTATFA